MSTEISLSAGIRSNLLALQKTDSLLQRTTQRLSTGKDVNSAVDNPVNFFAARNLSDRSTELSARLDGMGQAVQTVQVADNGIESIRSLLETMRSLIDQARGETDADERRRLGSDFNELIVQVSNIAKDSSYQGINLLQGYQTLTVQFAEKFGQSTLDINGVNVAVAGFVGGDSSDLKATSISGKVAVPSQPAQAASPSRGSIASRASAGSIGSQESVGSQAGLPSQPSLPSVPSQPSIASQGSIGSIPFQPSLASQASQGSIGSRASIAYQATIASQGSVSSNPSVGSVGGRASKGVGETAASVASVPSVASRASQASVASQGSIGSQPSLPSQASTPSRGSVPIIGTNPSIGSQAAQPSVAARPSVASQGSVGSQGSVASRPSRASRGAIASAGTAGTAGSVASAGSVPSQASQFSIGTQAAVAPQVSLASQGSLPSYGSQASVGRASQPSSGSRGSIASQPSRGSVPASPSVASQGTVGSKASVGSIASEPSIAARDFQPSSGSREDSQEYAFTLTINQTDEGELGVFGIKSHGRTNTAAGQHEVDWGSDNYGEVLAGLAASIDQMDEALKAQTSNLATNLSVVTLRENFTSELLAALQEGADKLTLADLNAEGANLLALQTASSLGIQSLSLASQQQQQVLRLLG